MPKEATLKQKKKRHSPLDVQIRDSEEPGVLRKPRSVSKKASKSSSHKGGRKPLSGKAARAPSSTTAAANHTNSSDDELVEDSFVSAQMSKKILREVEQQQREVADEDDGDSNPMLGSKGGAKHASKIEREQKAAANIDELVGDDDEDDEDGFDEQDEHLTTDFAGVDCAVSAEGRP